jgi:uncharacterized membrane protein YhiD involved in acid resistance
MIAFSYIATFKGLSFSRNFIQAMMLSSIVAAVIMQAIGDSLARGLGMIGALAIIRFRTNFKDSRDLIFMFAALAAGISCGVYAYAVGAVGTVGFCIAVVLLHFSPLERNTTFDGMLRFNISNTCSNRHLFEVILKKYCKVFALITLREMAQGQRWDYAYHVKMIDSNKKTTLLEELRQIESINGVSLLFQETTVEL